MREVNVVKFAISFPSKKFSMFFVQGADDGDCVSKRRCRENLYKP